MPYFELPNEDILYIHIPKTGGSSIEEYFQKKSTSGIKICNYLDDRLRKKYRLFSCKSAQHLKYENICKMQKEFNIDLNSNRLKIFASVRNPYDRILSDMFYNCAINPTASPEATFEAMKIYLSKDCYDTHNHPQHTFVTKDGKLIEGIIILKQESLKEDMKKNGYTDFDVYKNKTFNGIDVHYRKYLNNDSIELINNFFDKDFELFGYDKLQISSFPHS